MNHEENSIFQASKKATAYLCVSFEGFSGKFCAILCKVRYATFQVQKLSDLQLSHSCTLSFRIFDVFLVL